jgi:nitrite reductase [NAD(P)H] small subunit
MHNKVTRSRTVTLGPVDAIPLGEGRAFVVDGEAIAVFRTRAGGLFATQAFCPHRSGPLADGLIGRTTVLCPLHSFAFDLASGRSLGGACADLRRYTVSIAASGEILLELPGLRESASSGQKADACTLREGTAA